MKKILYLPVFLFVVLMASCEANSVNESLAIAPKNMAGKTLKVDGATIKFSSNTSGTISDYIGTAQKSSVSYQRTSEVTADLTFFYHSEDSYSMSERNYSLKLTFADETKGIASGKYTYKLKIAKGTKYEKSDSGTKTISDKIFNIY